MPKHAEFTAAQDDFSSKSGPQNLIALGYNQPQAPQLNCQTHLIMTGPKYGYFNAQVHCTATTPTPAHTLPCACSADGNLGARLR